jgi:hypothetical protein
MINDRDRCGLCARLDGFLVGCGFISLFAEYGLRAISFAEKKESRYEETIPN